LPFLVVAVVVPSWPDRRKVLVRSAGAVALSGATFLLSTPYFLLDFAQARRDLDAEANTPHAVADGLSPIGNFWWYVRDAVPGAITWALFVAALVGLALVLVQRQKPDQLLVAAFCVLYLVGISASKWHWERWTVQVLPVLLVFAAWTIDRLGTFARARTPSALRADIVVPLVLVILFVFRPVGELIDDARFLRQPSTWRLARNWLGENVPAGGQVVYARQLFNVKWPEIPRLGGGIEEDFALDPTRTLASYRAAGTDYIVTRGAEPFDYMTKPREYPREAVFFQELACTTRLVALIPAADDRVGPSIAVYRIDRAPVELLNVICTQRPESSA
jgi:hypothetical protein